MHSHEVQESFCHRSPSVRSSPELSVHSVLLRRFSSRLICSKVTKCSGSAFSQAQRPAPGSVGRENSAGATCFRKLVMVCCISETKSWKSPMEGFELFLEVAVMFPRLPPLPVLALQKHVQNGGYGGPFFWEHLT